MRVPVFMFHAVLSEKDDLGDADQHYITSLKDFNEYIKICRRNEIIIISLQNYMSKLYNEKCKLCCFTFDDGHVSNYNAACILYKNGFSADFFLNTKNINTEGFLSEKQVKNMIEMGMSIQSHGHTHVYFDELSIEEVNYQLKKSKEVIEEITNKRVNIFAPPGGRINKMVEGLCRKNSFNVIVNSRPGFITNNKKLKVIPRLTMLRTTSYKVFNLWLSYNKQELFKLQAKYFSTKLLKYILGNKLYEKFRFWVLQ